MEHDWLVFVNIVQQEYTRLDSRDHVVKIGTARTTLAHLHTLQTIQETLLVPVGLHAANKPSSGIG